jgi:hypothetical protein
MKLVISKNITVVVLVTLFESLICQLGNGYIFKCFLVRHQVSMVTIFCDWVFTQLIISQFVINK